MEIVPHGPSNPGFEPSTFQSQVQRSTDCATGAPLAKFINNKKKVSTDRASMIVLNLLTFFLFVYFIICNSYSLKMR